MNNFLDYRMRKNLKNMVLMQFLWEVKKRNKILNLTKLHIANISKITLNINNILELYYLNIILIDSSIGLIFWNDEKMLTLYSL